MGKKIPSEQCVFIKAQTLHIILICLNLEIIFLSSNIFYTNNQLHILRISLCENVWKDPSVTVLTLEETCHNSKKDSVPFTSGEFYFLSSVCSCSSSIALFLCLVFVVSDLWCHVRATQRHRVCMSMCHSYLL